VGEQQIPLFDADIERPLTDSTPANSTSTPIIDVTDVGQVINDHDRHTDISDAPVPMTTEPRRSIRTPHISNAGAQSSEYQQREDTSKGEGHEWATDRRRPKASPAIDWFELPTDREDFTACLAETKASHNIPRSYRHAMSTDPKRWIKPMQAEMETLKAKHTWDLVKPPLGANIMDSMWIFDIKWDGEGNRIKDKARLVGKGYTQQLGVDYNETWAGVTRLESVRMTAAIAAKHDLKLWRIDFVGAYLNSLTKEDIYMKQPEGFIEPGYEDYVAKLIHTIYGTMQGGHDWFETLGNTYNDLGYNTSRADPCV
jgi:hypothetical protein